MITEIKNQQDEHIDDDNIKGEILYAAEHDMEYTYFEDTRIDIISEKKTEDSHILIVHIGGV